MIDVARVTTKGQVTIPLEFRKKLNINVGDKVVFIEREGVLLLGNSNRIALTEFARAMEGEAEKAGIKNEDDVTKIVREIRQEIWESEYAVND